MMVLPSLSVKSYLYPLWRETFNGEPIYIQYDKDLVFYDGTDDKRVTTPTGAWGRITVRNSVNTPSLGFNPLNNGVGFVYFDLFFPESVIDAQFKAIAQKAFNLLANKRMQDSDGDKVETFSPTFNDLGFDGQFRHIQLSVEYYTNYFALDVDSGKAFNAGFDDGFS